jgi:hypothetical protein
MRAVRSKTQLQEFVHKYFRPEKERLALRFEQAMQDLTEFSLQKYRLRYVLAKLTQYVNERALGSETEANLHHFLDSANHVEHILPQHPSAAALREFDLPEEAADWAVWLGNLTLAEEPINTSLGNKPFSSKQPEYRNSQFYLTKLLSGVVSVGKNTAINRAVEGLPTFKEWSSKSIQKRQEALAELARKVWDMPTPKVR